MHLGGAGLAHHAHHAHRIGAAHDGIVDQHHPLAGQHRAVGAQLHAHAHFARVLGGLDEGAADIVVADDAHLEGQAAGLRVAQRGGHAGVGHRHHHVGGHAALLRQAPAHALAHLIDRAAVNHAVGHGEVDVFEHAWPRLGGGKGADGVDAVLGDHHHLAVLDVAHEAGADHVQGAGLRGEHRLAVQIAQHQGRMPRGSRTPISFLLVRATRA